MFEFLKHVILSIFTSISIFLFMIFQLISSLPKVYVVSNNLEDILTRAFKIFIQKTIIIYQTLYELFSFTAVTFHEFCVLILKELRILINIFKFLYPLFIYLFFSFKIKFCHNTGKTYFHYENFNDLKKMFSVDADVTKLSTSLHSEHWFILCI